MDERYVQPEIVKIWSNQNKLQLWQETELALIRAMASMGLVPQKAYDRIYAIWQSRRISISWWKERDKEVHHDLNAFLDERQRHLPPELQEHVHRLITSFDTQEAAFATMLKKSLFILEKAYVAVELELVSLAEKYRYTIMNGRTHGQEAELMTFGGRCLSWLKELITAHDALFHAKRQLKLSKLSGAIGKYGSILPELEAKTLGLLGFEPFVGATQIMPRIVYAPVAQAVCGLVLILEKIALDIRLGARSGRPIMREPFKKKQKGSSAMPHKKNPIRTEQMEGMARMARGYLLMIMENIRTWEERAIEQSCVERVAWPDLFHVAVHSFRVMGYVLSGLKVYPDNMLLEVHDSRGTYASAEVKEWLKARMAPLGFSHNDVYRLVQLACFNVFEPPSSIREIRDLIPASFQEAAKQLQSVSGLTAQPPDSIRELILGHRLRPSEELDVPPEKVEEYNRCLEEIFANKKEVDEWRLLFEPEYLLRNDHFLYDEILGKEEEGQKNGA